MRGTLTIFFKELKDTLRDRRTIIVMVVLPLFLFPVLLGIVSGIQKNQQKKAQEKQLRVAVIAPDSNTAFLGILGKQKEITIVDDIPEDSIVSSIENEKLDGAYVFSATFKKDVEDLKPGGVTLYFKSTGDQNIIKQRLREPLKILEKEELESRFQRLNLDSSIIKPVKVNEIDITSSKELFGKMIGGFLPYIFVIFCFIGSMLPAIDLTAGEKERGTIETLLASPANRFEILCGKFMLVSLTGITSALISLLSLYIAFHNLSGGFSDFPPEIRNVILDLLEPKSIIMLVSLLLPLTMFFAGILLSLSMYAKTFKEAQGIITPLNLIILIPVVIGLMPGIEFNTVTALIPVLNVSLASKAIFAGTIEPVLLAEAYVSLIILAGLALYAAAKFFSMESVIFRN